ncbi:MAG: hypothetical protein EZS28_040889, partial [Streblomastix strix]
AGEWIRLCVFPTGASVGNPFIEFKLHTMNNAVQTIRLLPYYTVNGINTVYGIFTAPTKFRSYFDIDNGIRISWFYYDSCIRQRTYFTNRMMEILTQDVVSGVLDGTKIPITYYLADGGIINNMLQVNPAGLTYTTFDNGIRIGNYNTEYSSLYQGCSTTAINTTKVGQWEISKTNDGVLTINPLSLRKQTGNMIGSLTLAFSYGFR